MLKLESNSSLKEIKILNVCWGKDKGYGNRDKNEQVVEQKEWKEFEKKMEKMKFIAKVEIRKEGFENKEIPCLIIERID